MTPPDAQETPTLSQQIDSLTGLRRENLRITPEPLHTDADIAHLVAVLS